MPYCLYLSFSQNSSDDELSDSLRLAEAMKSARLLPVSRLSITDGRFA